MTAVKRHLVLAAALAAAALLWHGGERAHAGDSPPPGSGWVLAGYENHYYTYYVTERVGTTTYSQLLYMEPYQDRVVYSQETRLSAITWYSRQYYSYTKLLSYRSYCYLNPYYPWDMQCTWTSEYRTDTYYTPDQQYWYTTVNVPSVQTDYRPVYGSAQLPVYRRVAKTGVCSVPVYQFVGGEGSVVMNGDGTFTMWVPQSSCLYSPYTYYWSEAQPQVVRTGQACRQKLNASLGQSTSYESVYVWTSITYGVVSSQRHQCQTIYVPQWQYSHSYDCTYEVGCEPAWSRTTVWYSPDGLLRYTRTENHPSCPNCWVYCTTVVERLVSVPQTDCRYMPYDYIQQYQTGEYRQNTRYNYSEQRWYSQQCWDTYALTTASIPRSEMVDRYVPSTSWQQMTLQMPALPDVVLGVNPGIGLTGLSSWFWVEAQGAEAQGPNGIRVRLVPSRYEWDFDGDGQVDLSTTSPGRRYPVPSDVQHTYERSSLQKPGQQYQVKVRVYFDLQLDAGQGYNTVGVISQERVKPYPVQQLQGVIGS